MSNPDDIEEIFSHIKQIRKENNDDTSSLDKNCKLGHIKNISKMNIKSDGNAIIKDERIHTQPSNETIINNKTIDNRTIVALNELDKIIKRINKVSRMTMDHEMFKNEKHFDDLAKQVASWSGDNFSLRTCDLCNTEIELEKNLSGLVIAGEFFACENCCQNSEKNHLSNWTKSRMTKPSDVRPIGLWVTQEKNRG